MLKRQSFLKTVDLIPRSPKILLRKSFKIFLVFILLLII